MDFLKGLGQLAIFMGGVLVIGYLLLPLNDVPYLPLYILVAALVGGHVYRKGRERGRGEAEDRARHREVER